MAGKSFDVDGTIVNIPTELAELNEDSKHQTVTDVEKSKWDNKQDPISDLGEIRLGANAGEKAVSYENQSLTSEQQAQARSNIGAGTSNFSGSYNDLADKPEIPTTTNSVTKGSPEALTSGGAYNNLAKKDASNLSSANVDSWQNALVTPYSRHLNTNLEFTDISSCSTLQEIVDLAKANKGQLHGRVGNTSDENTPLRALLGNPSGFGNYTIVSSSACYRLGDTHAPNAYVVELVAVGLYIGKLAKGYVFHDQTSANWSGWTILK